MENPNAFDLNKAVAEWRNGLAQNPAFRRDDLEQLESHLRDGIARWTAQGLTTDEAFLIATRRLGAAPALATEFAKVNTDALWLERAYRVVVGAVSINLVQAISTLMDSFYQVFCWRFLPKFIYSIPITKSLYGYVALALPLATAGWLLSTRRRAQPRMSRLADWASSHPIKASTALVAVSWIARICSIATGQIVYSMPRYFAAYMISSLVAVMFMLPWAILLGWLLHRRRQLATN